MSKVLGYMKRIGARLGRAFVVLSIVSVFANIVAQRVVEAIKEERKDG